MSLDLVIILEALGFIVIVLGLYCVYDVHVRIAALEDRFKSLCAYHDRLSSYVVTQEVDRLEREAHKSLFTS
jgi:hypothetical protein